MGLEHTRGAMQLHSHKFSLWINQSRNFETQRLVDESLYWYPKHLGISIRQGMSADNLIPISGKTQIGVSGIPLGRRSYVTR